jgi:hypothetical protein
MTHITMAERKKKDKNGVQSPTQKPKDRATHSPLKPVVNSGFKLKFANICNPFYEIKA